VDASFDIGPGCYSFVGVRDFGAPALGAVILDRERNVTIINNTTNITNITTNNSTVYTGGPSYAKLAARSSRPIPTLKLVRQTDAGAIRAANGKVLSRQSGNQLLVLAPHVTAPEGGKLPAPPHVARTLTGATADHGWDVVKDPGERANMEAKFKASAKGSSLAARPVKQADVDLVSEKIKTSPKSYSEGEATPSEKTTKTKTKKNSEDLTALENAPATGDETPKAKKSHKYGDESATGDETPAPRKKKSKKSPTPDEYGDTDYKNSKSDDSSYKGSADSDETVKPKKSYDDEYKPTVGSDDTDKPKKSYDDEYKTKETEGSDYSPGEPRTPKVSDEGDNGGKIDKKKKGEPGSTPGQY